MYFVLFVVGACFVFILFWLMQLIFCY
jgi:hypothetical protein